MPSQDTPARRLTLTLTSSLNLGSSLEVGSITVRSSFSSVGTKDRQVSVGGGSWLPSHRWGDREQRRPQGLLTEQPCSQAHGRGGRAYLPGSHGAPTLVFREKRWGAGGALIQIWRKVTINKPEEELSFTKKACDYVRWYGQKHLAGGVLKKKIAFHSKACLSTFCFCFVFPPCLALTMDHGHQ